MTDDTVTLMVRVPPSLRASLKVAAAKHGIPMRDYLARLHALNDNLQHVASSPILKETYRETAKNHLAAANLLLEEQS